MLLGEQYAVALYSYQGISIPRRALSRSRNIICDPVPPVTLQAVLCIAATTREPCQMQQEPEALGEIRTGVKPWLLWPSEPSDCFFCQGDNHTQSLAHFVKLAKEP